MQTCQCFGLNFKKSDCTGKLYSKSKQLLTKWYNASLIYGFGVQYWLSKKWRLSANGTFIPKSETYNQPSISQASLGFEYHLQQVDDKTANDYANNQYFFPKNIFQINDLILE